MFAGSTFHAVVIYVLSLRYLLAKLLHSNMPLRRVRTGYIDQFQYKAVRPGQFARLHEYCTLVVLHRDHRPDICPSL